MILKLNMVFRDTIVNSWLVIQNLKIAKSRGFIFPEAFRPTLVKEIVRIENVELRPLTMRENITPHNIFALYKRSQALHFLF